ncbi:1-deoxy-D-xylulose-5-phosphate synthase [Streptosporangium sp. 'caverna']|uniref:1-deoxy-D-xylulose-5-phosphate synthase n=1 Tax=Streptosporangium sp. 'caverna' TaxID=2202249 RepID=UPI000D7DCCC6|nr:1-deoxy-D-xylulose-5-phosphate synthase [Streptosporangium sp. 'caverna']AWS43495.1 1-deoxy-D-xylulose-5-phosphate synthase [Streptosporangium sp. 'caverna']
MKPRRLSTITGPRDLDRLSPEELAELAGEIRDFLVLHVARTGGHLGPNLGVVETTIAIHRVFDSPRDSIVFDVGHQSYVHKLLTGRQDFGGLRQKGGIAGYPQRSESAHDIVESSHASSSLSWADGISRAYALTRQHDRHVVVVIGDGALTGGMTWEALNNITDDNKRNLVVVVNDNGRSYEPTVGGLARFLGSVRAEHSCRNPHHGSRPLSDASESPSRSGGFSGDRRLYTNLDIKCLGPVDGHDLRAMEEALRQAKGYRAPVIVHAITQKGHGYEPARNDVVDRFHAIGPIDPVSGLAVNGPASTWTSVFGEAVAELAATDERIVAVTAAMLRSTGLQRFSERFPDRVIDVGLAEQHAVTSAAGLAFGGLHPVVAIYATFMNRAFDQVLMDVALHGAGVTFVLDRAGVTGPDGPSHHGVWDIGLLLAVPGIRIAAPRDAARLREELAEAVRVEDAPTVLRVPRGRPAVEIGALRRLPDGVDVVRESSRHDVLIIAVGPFVRTALEIADLLDCRGVGATVVDPRWIIPIAPGLAELAAHHHRVVTMEDGLRVAGFGTHLRQALIDAGVSTPVSVFGLPSAFLPHGSRDEILVDSGLTAPRISQEILKALRADTSRPHARSGRRGALAEEFELEEVRPGVVGDGDVATAVTDASVDGPNLAPRPRPGQAAAR